MSELVARIATRLQKVGITPSLASVEAGLNSSAVRDIVNGRSKSPSLATLEALCGPLECTIGYLVGAEEEASERSIPGFWMVLGIGQGVPRYRHGSLQSAQYEAQRLAAQNAGVCFVVLEAVDAYGADQPKVHQITLGEPDLSDDIPF